MDLKFEFDHDFRIKKSWKMRDCEREKTLLDGINMTPGLNGVYKGDMWHLREFFLLGREI